MSYLNFETEQFLNNISRRFDKTPSGIAKILLLACMVIAIAQFSIDIVRQEITPNKWPPFSFTQYELINLLYLFLLKFLLGMCEVDFWKRLIWGSFAMQLLVTILVMLIFSLSLNYQPLLLRAETAVTIYTIFLAYHLWQVACALEKGEQKTISSGQLPQPKPPYIKHILNFSLVMGTFLLFRIWLCLEGFATLTSFFQAFVFALLTCFLLVGLACLFMLCTPRPGTKKAKEIAQRDIGELTSR